MKKFNGFENWMIHEAMNQYIERAETEIKSLESKSKSSLFAPGYFTVVGKELLEKVDDLTKVNDLKSRKEHSQEIKNKPNSLKTK